MASITFNHVSSIPYSDPPSRLQTLDVWLPYDSSPAEALWVVYLHGGAWRDPSLDARQIEPTLEHLFASHTSIVQKLGGIASLNYRLSPHADRPTEPGDTERSATHPQHIRDVAHGIQYLRKTYDMKRWIGVGHSCGATLFAQLVAGIGLEEADKTIGPEALILLEGIYNIPLLLQNHSPPTCPENISQIYASFVAGAFGHDKAVYHAVSPVAGRYNKSQWPEGRLFVICHSYEDELVERAQRDVMCVALDREGWSIVMEVGDEEDEVRAEGRRVLNVRDLIGNHNYVWEDGTQIAKLVEEVVERLT